jgi:uncharacterized protein (TIGR04255 family)
VEVARPPRTERIGVRFINRVEEPDLPLLPSLVQAPMLAGLAVPTSEHGVTVAHTLSEALYQLPSDRPALLDALQARWGQLPGGATLDPTLPALDMPSWVLDIDSSRAGAAEFTAEEISKVAEQLARRAYRFFRWAVTLDFLKHFGGEV